jgi:hypothetical protein
MIPPELKPYLPEILFALLGLLIGWWVSRLSAAAKIAASAERCRAEERRATDLDARLAITREEAERNELDARGIRNQLVELRTRLDLGSKDAATHKQLVERVEALTEKIRQLENSLSGPILEFRQAISALEFQVLETSRRIDHLSSATKDIPHPAGGPVDEPPAPGPQSPPSAAQPDSFADLPATPGTGGIAEIESFAAYLQQAEAAERAQSTGFAHPPTAAPHEVPSPAKVPATAIAALARASEVSARHQPESQAITLNPQIADSLLTPDMDDGFSFVPDPPASARNAATDLRSALGEAPGARDD